MELAVAYTLVYDSDCGPCAAFRRVVGFLDPAHKMRYLGLAEAQGSGLLSSVPPPLRARSFHLVTKGGMALSGTAAIATLASQLPGGPFTSAAIDSNPIVSWAVGFAYTALSRLHETGSCAVRG